jgi:PAS domain S-box-containing protein
MRVAGEQALPRPNDDASGEQILARLAAREAELARVQQIGQIGGLTVDLRGEAFRNTRSPEYLAVHGLPPEAAHETHEDWVRRIHPEDRDRVVSHFLQTVRGTATDYEIEYRIIRPSDGQTRWILAKAAITRDESGAPLQLQGAHIDMTARRRAEEQHELIARELAHRIANIFTVVNSLVRMAARTDPAHREFAAKLEERFAALHRAHGFVIGDKERIGHGNLTELLARLLDPYRQNGDGRISIEGADAPVGQHAATALALIVHELATNAVKYGGLSAETGSVTVTVTQEADSCRITWRESGGPVLASRPERTGFGTAMVERAARGQLGATIAYDWTPGGLVATISAKRDDLRR